MAPIQKPEWIALADSDKPVMRRKFTKGLPILAVAVTAAIIGAGSIFAQPQELSVANADPISVASSQNSLDIESTDSGVPKNESSAAQSSVTPDIASLPSNIQGDDADYVVDNNGVDDEGDDD